MPTNILSLQTCQPQTGLKSISCSSPDERFENIQEKAIKILQTKNLHTILTNSVYSKLYLVVIALLLPATSSLFSQIQFKEVAPEIGIDHHYLGINEMGAGAAFFDMDNDGDEDLWLTGGLKRDALYENDGTGHFTEIGEQAGLRATFNKVTTGVITGDLDNDGFKDILLITHIGFPNVLLRNKGDKTFEEVYKTGLEEQRAYSLAAAMGDVNQDGYLDIYAGNYIEKDELTYSDANRDTINGFNHQCHENQLYLNNGDWTFSEVAKDWAASDNGCALATAFSDYDGDFDSDLIVANDFGAWVSPNVLLANQSEENTFQDISESSHMNVGIYGMGIAIGDCDNDLDLDYYITNLGENVFLRNEGNSKFINKTKEAGITNTTTPEGLLATGWGTAFMDVDNDSYLDLYVVNGYVPAASFIANSKANPNILYLNNGQGIFTPTAPELASTSWGRGFAYADIDNDGDVDFVVGNVNKQATSDTIQLFQVFRNETDNGHHWLKVRLEGTTNNKDGLGSRIYLKSEGQWFLQEANGGYGTHASQHSNILHFGLDDKIKIDSLVVYWLGGKAQIITDIAVNQTITIKEENLISSINTIAEKNISLSNFPNPFTNTTTIEYRIKEAIRNITINIFDQLGRPIFTLPNGQKTKGSHHFVWTAPAAGIYYIHLQTDNQILYKTIISN